MSRITNFLPSYRELNSIITYVVNKDTVSYDEQKAITEFYRQYSEEIMFDKMVLDIVLEKDKST